MSLRSLYESGPDEEWIFRLTNPETHPNTKDDIATAQEVERLSAPDYDDAQDKFDEQESQSDIQAITDGLQTLSPHDITRVLRFVQQASGQDETTSG